MHPRVDLCLLLDLSFLDENLVFLFNYNVTIFESLLDQVSDVVKEDFSGVYVLSIALYVVIIFCPQLNKVCLRVVFEASRFDNLSVVAKSHVLVHCGIDNDVIIALSDKGENCLSCIFRDQMIAVSLIGSCLV